MHLNVDFNFIIIACLTEILSVKKWCSTFAHLFFFFFNCNVECWMLLRHDSISRTRNWNGHMQPLYNAYIKIAYYYSHFKNLLPVCFNYSYNLFISQLNWKNELSKKKIMSYFLIHDTFKKRYSFKVQFFMQFFLQKILSKKMRICLLCKLLLDF